MALTLNTSGGGRSRPAAKPTSGKAVRYAGARPEDIVVSQSVLAACLGVTTQQILHLCNQGVLSRVDGSSDCALVASVRAYIARLRDRRAGTKGGMELEVLRWRAANLRQRNRDWQIEFGRRVAAELLEAQMGDLARYRAWVDGGGGVLDGLDRLMDAIDATDIDAVARAAADGEDAGDDEGGGDGSGDGGGEA